MKCILIDDDPDEIEIFSFAISGLSKDIVFTGYTNFDQAVSEMCSQADDLPDFIFLDGFMQRRRGIECLASLKADELLKAVPIVIYSGFISDKDRSEALALGAYDIVVKPSRLPHLREILKQILDNYKAQP